MMKVMQLSRNISAFYLQWARMFGVVWRIVKPTYHSGVEWLIADVTDVSTLHQLSVFYAWVIVRLTLRYTTPDIHCRDRFHECDGGINRLILARGVQQTIECLSQFHYWRPLRVNCKPRVTTKTFMNVNIARFCGDVD